MKNVWRIVKKELFRVFSDKRAVLSLIMPGIIMLAMYSVIGVLVGSSVTSIEESVSKVAVYGQGIDAINEYIDPKYIEINEVQEFNKEDLTQSVKNGDYSLVVNIFEYDAQTKTIKCEFIYDKGDENSSTALSRFINVLEVYNNTVNAPIYEYSLQNVNTENKDFSSMMVVGMIMPMFVVMFIFAGALNICPDSFAGEKERGTLATLVMTPVKRSHIMAGKTISNTILTIIAASISFLGVVGSLILAGDKLNATGFQISLDGLDYLYLFITIIMTALIAVSLLTMISVFAGNIKEANSYSTPIYIVGMLLGLMPGYSFSSVASNYKFLYPIYNCGLAVKQIIFGEIKFEQILILSVTTIVLFTIICFITSKLFKREGVVFGS